MSHAEKRLPYNILLITCDQLRYFRDDEWPEGFTLPNMERLKEMGISFDNHYICASVCTPSRASMYTGLHTPVHGVFDVSMMPVGSPDRLPSQHKTLGHWLASAGYYTAYKGKWHLDQEIAHPPQGFDVAREMKARYGFEDYDGEVSSRMLGGYYQDEGIAASAIAWLRRQGRGLNNGEKPWFLAVNFVNPHDIMFYGHAGQEKNPGNRLSIPHGEPKHEVYQPQWSITPNNWQQSLTLDRPAAHLAFRDTNDLFTGPVDYTLDDWRRYNSFYLNSTRLLDRQIGRLIRELEEQRIMDKTVILFTSDHGELAGAHGGMKGKGPVIYEEAIHVPMVMVHPDYRGGRRCPALTGHIDLVPTILGNTDMAPGLRAQIEALPGHDMTPLLANPETGKLRDALLFAFDMLTFLDSNPLQTFLMNRKRGASTAATPNMDRRGLIRMAFDGRYKFARYFAPSRYNTPETMEALLAHNDLELYDLEENIRETVNLGADPAANGELIIGMNEKLNRLIEREVGEDKGEMLPRRENGPL
uniref:Arylsulfatase n=1 Tax=Candidatus Kentrum sp. UNK TaxID=2126344 RepID=A0A451B0N5_9GAMM|nr:MAG: arylsulfatase [Candidatus Kentron sp. UNK]VFK71847.1 MAG: arylsulfatase [Candidatus Kentron sp. UNK]